jgi:hypothetical protein
MGWMTRCVERSGWIFAGVAAIVAVAFPTTGAGKLAMLIVAGAIGVAAVDHIRRIPRVLIKPPAAGAIAIGVVVIASAIVFVPIFGDVGWTMGDWGIQHAVMKQVAAGLHDGHVPTWSHSLSTGEAPLETYPAMTYLIDRVLAIATGLEEQLPLFLLIFGVVIHTLVAVGITRLCLRVAPAPIAAIAGLTQLVDSGPIMAGGIGAGGIASNLEWALIHNALAQAFSLLALMAVVAAIERPRLRTSSRSRSGPRSPPRHTRRRCCSWASW